VIIKRQQNRQYNDQKKKDEKTKNGQPITAQKTKDSPTWILQHETDLWEGKQLKK
jgi:hypothetical protein